MTTAEVERLLAHSGLGDASAVVEALEGNAAVRIRAQADIYPASMIKLPIAAALARLVASGVRRDDEMLTVAAANVTPNDAPSPFLPGYAATIRACADAMLSASDNVATNVLIDALGRDAITRECAALGLSGTAVRRKLSGALPLIDDPQAAGRNAHPAADAAHLLRLVALECDAGESWIYDALLAQVWNDKLSRGWDATDVFAHKTGDTDDSSHDGGILTLPGGRRFIVVVYTTLPANPETAGRFAAFARGLRPLLQA
jgi:beta-lactamase class A